MKTLHLITCEPDFSKFKTLLNEDDEIVLLSEGVYHQASLYKELAESGLLNTMKVLHKDLELRGLEMEESITTIDYQHLVELTLKTERSITW